MHPIVDAMIHFDGAPRFTTEEREHIKKFNPSGRPRLDPREALIKRAMIQQANREWYSDYWAKLRSLERAERL